MEECQTGLPRANGLALCGESRDECRHGDSPQQGEVELMTMPVREQSTAKNTKKPRVTKRAATDPRQPGSKAGARTSKTAKTASNAGLARPGTKADKILSLLRRSDGASLQELRQSDRVAGTLGPRLPERCSEEKVWLSRTLHQAEEW